jgi:hypothetical protein
MGLGLGLWCDAFFFLFLRGWSSSTYTWIILTQRLTGDVLLPGKWPSKNWTPSPNNLARWAGVRVTTPVADSIIRVLGGLDVGAVDI